MTESKRFRTAYVCGDTGIIDEQAKPEWFVENIRNVNDLEKNFDLCIEKMNALHEENEELKSKYSEQCIKFDFLEDENQHMRKVINENEHLKNENEELKRKNKKLMGLLENLGIDFMGLLENLELKE